MLVPAVLAYVVQSNDADSPTAPGHDAHTASVVAGSPTGTLHGISNPGLLTATATAAGSSSLANVGSSWAMSMSSGSSTGSSTASHAIVRVRTARWGNAT